MSYRPAGCSRRCFWGGRRYEHRFRAAHTLSGNFPYDDDMESEVSIDIAATGDAVLELAGAVERWPEFLPHYRWVKALDQRAGKRLVEMAAWRQFGPRWSPLRYPVRWTAVVQPQPERRVLRFRHVRGPTRGMEVEWRVQERDGGVNVTIWHRFHSRLPLVGGFYAEWIAGRLFIGAIAGRTLRCFKHVLEERDPLPDEVCAPAVHVPQ